MQTAQANPAFTEGDHPTQSQLRLMGMQRDLPVAAGAVVLLLSLAISAGSPVAAVAVAAIYIVAIIAASKHLRDRRSRTASR